MYIDSQAQYNDKQIAQRHILYFYSELALFLHLKLPHLLTDNFLASNWSLLTAMHKLYKPGWNLCTPQRRSLVRSLKILGIVA